MIRFQKCSCFKLSSKQKHKIQKSSLWRRRRAWSTETDQAAEWTHLQAQWQQGTGVVGVARQRRRSRMEKTPENTRKQTEYGENIGNKTQTREAVPAVFRCDTSYTITVSLLSSSNVSFMTQINSSASVIWCVPLNVRFHPALTAFINPFVHVWSFSD